MIARTLKKANTLACVAVMALAVDATAQPRYETVHIFSGDRGAPIAALIEGADGRLYGTTRSGGFHGKGSVFVTDAAGFVTVLHEFDGTDGAAPMGRLLVAPDGTLYGTASSGAAGFGNVYRLMPDGSAFEVVVTFTGPNGLIPRDGLVLGPDGALYGTTSAGGALPGSVGTIFRVSLDGTFTTLVTFEGINGATPTGDLIVAADGLYGTTAEGGAGFAGTVFRAGFDGSLTTLASFDGSAGGGMTPAGGVVLASDGNLYGATLFGGTNGLGTLFRVTPTGLETINSFSGPDGASPTGALRELSDGHLYGTTSGGGSNNLGTVFRLALDGTVTTVASFSMDDGNFPASGVIETIGGGIFGTTESGGPSVFGTVFELRLMPEAAIRTVVSFSGASIADPFGGLVEASDGNFYGIALSGGTDGFGAVYKMTPDGTVSLFASFPSGEGFFPTGALIQASDGHLYGTSEGGPTGDGAVFRVTLDGTLTTIGMFDFFVTGAAPSGRLIEAGDGQLYGTTLFGANGAPGGVFRVNRADGTISVVATFAADESQGSLPTGGVLEAPDGSFYGTAQMGGANGFGTVFRVSGGEVSTMASFDSASGSNPASPLLLASDGKLYGTTTAGGANEQGTLFRLTLGETPTLSALVSFDGISGAFPFLQGVVEASEGVFSGTTTFGGEEGLGTFYQWSEAGGLTFVHRFDGVSGEQPNATLIKAADGGLYGTAFGPQGGVIYRFVNDGAAASLQVAPAYAIYGGTTTLSATLTVSGAPISGLAIAFSLNGAAVGSAVTGENGIASLANVSVAGLGAGSYPDVIVASCAGSDAIGSVQASGDLSIAKATPTIVVNDATFIYDGQPHPATGAVTGVGGEVLGPLTFTYNGATTAPIDPGTYTVIASYAGDDNYEPESASATLTIAPAPAGLSGLVAAYAFNEGAGSVAGDASGRGHGGVIQQAQWAVGRFGGGLYFDGVNDWVTVNDAAALDIRNAITIEAWVNPRARSSWNTVVMKESDVGLAYALYSNTDTLQPAGYLNVAGADRSALGTAALPVDQWSHVAMTYDGLSMRLFVNGVEVRRRALTGRILTTNGALRIGGNSVWGEYFKGLIDEVRIYDRALNVLEIRRDMTTPVAFERVAPSVAITSPSAGAVLSGMRAVTVSASDNLAISSVQLQVDGVPVGAADATAPFVLGLDAANGTYVLTALARDVAGNTAVSDPITVTIANAPVAAYDFEEASGARVIDASGRNNDGSITGGATRTVDVTRGRVLSFNGADGLVSVPDAASLDLTTAMTLEAWVRPTALTGWRTVIMKEGEGLSYALYANDDAPWSAGYVQINGVDRAIRGPRPLALNTWTHLAMTYDGAMLRLFVNGAEVASRAQTGTVHVSNGALRIGGNTVWGEWFQGQIDSVRLYDVAVGAAQIVADMSR